ncbi:hypothetical protein NKH77_52145 [Streptomyces sp. M19]
MVGELVHRLTGLPLRDFVHQHIAKPLGADFQIGLHDADVERVADVIAPVLDFDPRHSITTPPRTRPSPVPRSAPVRPTHPRGAPPIWVRPTGTATPCQWPRFSPHRPSRSLRPRSTPQTRHHRTHLRRAVQRRGPRQRTASEVGHRIRDARPAHPALDP